MKSDLLSGLEVRLVKKDEFARWKIYMNHYHYLGYHSIPGESLRYVALIDGVWVGLIAWGSAALKCRVRDEYIGWADDIKYKRLSLITNNTRFLIFPWINIKNLASKILSYNLRLLPNDYKLIYNHPVYLAETFVDESLFYGTCYKASNWLYLGRTKGFSKNGRHYYINNRPKGVYVYPLSRHAKEMLTAPFLPAGGLHMNDNTILSLKDFPIEGLKDAISSIVDPRKKRGVRHDIKTILAVCVCAVLCGARSYLAIWGWANSLPEDIKRRFGMRRNIPPSEPTFRRVLQGIDAEQFDKRIGMWISDNIKGKAIALDGKTLKGSNDEGKRFHLLSAIVHKEGVVINQKRVDDKTNEIGLIKPLIDDIPAEGAVITADALLAQRDIARHIVEAKKAHYLFTVKDNQKTLLNDIKSLRMEAFPP